MAPGTSGGAPKDTLGPRLHQDLRLRFEASVWVGGLRDKMIL